MTKDYIIVPGTDRKVFEGTVVVLNRLPGTKWIIHCGYYEYNGRKQKGWYFSSIPSNTTMPVFKEDLVAMTIIDDCPGPCPPGPQPPYPPFPPFPPGPPVPPAPVPVIFTPDDKKMIQRSMITVPNLSERDKLSSSNLVDGKIVRVNDASGSVDYFEWDAANETWVPATLGYRYLTRDEIMDLISDIEGEIDSDVVSIAYSDSKGALVVERRSGDREDVPITGIVHDPVFLPEDLTLTIPVFGRDDVKVTIPRDKVLKDARFEISHQLPSGKYGPAIIFIVSDGVTDNEVVMDATNLYNIYKGSESEAIKVYIDTESSSIVADIKLSSLPNNALKIDNEGLFVNISGKVDKKPIEKGYVLVADGLGGFTYADPGVMVQHSGDMLDSNSHIATNDVILKAIRAAIKSTEDTVESEIDEIRNKVSVLRQEITEAIALIHKSIEEVDDRISEIENTLPDFSQEGNVVITDGHGFETSAYTIGGDTLSTDSTTTIATEEAVADALSWKGIDS